MITDGTMYIRQNAKGAFVPVRDKSLGSVWEQRNKAQNILENCVTKGLRKRFKIQKVVDEIVESNSEPKSKVKSEAKSKVPKTEFKAETNINAARDEIALSIGNQEIKDNMVKKWEDDISGFSNFIQDAESRKESLLTALSDVDQEISDINHYIEFGKFNCYQGWLAYNMLRNRLKKRRKIKDELNILIRLGNCKINSEMINEIQTTIGNLKTKKYKPRKLKELFE